VDSTISIILAIIGVLGGAGAWQFYSKKIELNHDASKSVAKDQNLFRDQVLERMQRLEKELQEANAKVLDLTAEVHTLRVKVDYLTKENDRLLKR
jgi:phage shock protein A